MSFNCFVFIRPLDLCCHQHVKALQILKSTSTKPVLLCCIGDELFALLLIYFCSQRQQTDFLWNLFLNVLFILYTQKFILLFQSKTLGEIFHYCNQQVSCWAWKILDSHRLYQDNYKSIVLRAIRAFTSLGLNWISVACMCMQGEANNTTSFCIPSGQNEKEQYQFI